MNTPAIVTITFANNPTAAVLGGFPTTQAINSVASFAGLSLNKAGTGYTLYAASPGLASAVSAPFTISSTTHFGLTAPATVQAGLNGSSVSLTVGALTAATTRDPFYQGTVAITATNGMTTLTLVPGGYTFTATDKGKHLFVGLNLPTASRWTITATDSGKATVVGRATVTVTLAPSIVPATPIIPGAAVTGLGVAAPSSVRTDTGFNVTVAAHNASGSLVTQYQGTVTITATSGTTTLPLVSSYTFTAADKGRHVFTGLELPTAGRWTITVTDADQPSVIGRAVMTVTVPPPATHFRVTAPARVKADTGISLTVTALTASGALAAWYQGTVTITATNGTTRFTLLPSYTFTTADNGKRTFSFALPMAGRWTITVMDTGNATVLGRRTLTVTAPPVSGPTMLTFAPLSLVQPASRPGYPFAGWIEP